MKTYSSSYPFITFLAVALLCLSVVSCSVNNGDDGGVTPGLPPPSHHEFPRWSPDGQTILYYSSGLILYDPSNDRTINNPDSVGIWAMNPDGTNQRKLLSAGYADWSPDGEWIVYVAGTQIFKVRFNGVNIDSSSITQLTFEGRNFFPDWSPDGQWIAYDSNVDSPTGLNFVWKMKADGTEKQRIAYTPEEGETRMPSWSLGGNKIAHIRFLVGVFSSEIYSMNADGSAPIRLTDNEDTDRYPEYSPDGAKIVFQSDGKIVSMDTDGENIQQLNSEGLMPDWSPSGNEIVFIGPQKTIWIMNKNGSNPRQITTRPEGPINN